MDEQAESWAMGSRNPKKQKINCQTKLIKTFTDEYMFSVYCSTHNQIIAQHYSKELWIPETRMSLGEIM